MNSIKEKINEIFNENDINTAVEVIFQVMKELVCLPQSVDPEGSIDRTIDMVCEETFG